MTRDQIVNRVQGIREKLRTHYIEQAIFSDSITAIISNTELEKMVKLSTCIMESNKLVYTALMKTGTLLGYGGEESPYPKDNSAEVGPIQIPEFWMLPTYMNPKEIRPEDIDLAIGGTKALRIQLQELITDLDSFRVSEVVDRNFVRLYDALTVELITAKHWLGLLLNELNKPMKFEERGLTEGAELPKVPFGDDFEKENVESKLAESAHNFKMEEDKTDGFNIIDGRANPEEAIDKNE